MYLHFGKSAIELIKDTERFKAWIDGFGVWGVIVFLVIRIVQIVFKFIPTDSDTPSGDNVCKWDNVDHGTSFWGRLVKFFHSILYFFAHLFGRK